MHGHTRSHGSQVLASLGGSVESRSMAVRSSPASLLPLSALLLQEA